MQRCTYQYGDAMAGSRREGYFLAAPRSLARARRECASNTGVTSRHCSCPHDGSQRIRHTHLNGAGLSRVGVHIAERAFFKIPVKQIFHVKIQPDLVIDLVVAQ
jgi:hypothetical protein